MANCLLIGEVGINHGGSVDTAHQMIDAAADAGVDCVKFQMFKTSDFVTDPTLTHNGESQVAMFERCELPDKAWPELRDHATGRGLIFFATPTSVGRLVFLIDLGVPLLKNGSDYIGHLPLIQAMARSGLPTILSTGMATWDDVDLAVNAFDGAGGRDLTLMHCTSVYPCPPAETNLRRITRLAGDYGTKVGFSDHTVGTTAAVAAVALGACMVERHFTLGHGMEGPDHHFSADPDELRALVAAVRETEVMLGSSRIEPTAHELQSRSDFRLSCVAARDLPAGHVLEEADIAFRRPGTGVPPSEVAWLLGVPLVAAVREGELL